MKDERRKVVINVEVKNEALLRAMDKERAPLEWSRADLVLNCLRQRYGMQCIPGKGTGEK